MWCCLWVVERAEGVDSDAARYSNIDVVYVDLIPYHTTVHVSLSQEYLNLYTNVKMHFQDVKFRCSIITPHFGTSILFTDVGNWGSWATFEMLTQSFTGFHKILMATAHCEQLNDEPCRETHINVKWHRIANENWYIVYKLRISSVSRWMSLGHQIR